MSHIDVMKQALEYLQDNQHLIADNERHAYVMEYNAFIERFEQAIAEAEKRKPWVGLTDEEKSDLWCKSTGRDCVNEDTHVFADAIEAKLKEKNTKGGAA